MKRVAVTGLGILSPVGLDLESCWSAVINGVSGISKVNQVDLSRHSVQIGGEVKNFEPAAYFSNEKEAKRNQRFVQMSVAASRMALKDSGLILTDELKNDTGVSIGVGVGGLAYLEEQIITMHEKDPSRVSPFTIPGFIANMAAGITAMELGAKGPNICVTTACTSGTHSIGEALMLIQTGRAKVMIAGGAEAALSHLSYAGFGKMKALCSRFADEPARASRPFDKERCGFVMGEGAGILVLEDLEFAKARGARIYAELSGYGMSGDAYHMTSPAPGGEGAVRAMAQALKTAGLNPEDVGYINAHGTSTEANDANETAAIKTLFGAHARAVNISSTKSMTGHLLGAAGGIEAVFSVMALKTGIIPPTINYENPDPECDLNYTANKAVERPLKAVISNSFGFGGTNGCIAFSAFR
ncbi:MAG: beta-ketoacyl-[acyl-carrier-protein] synthase II [Proteobacteria bacterium]|nr:beta-ketoacyl-[acyl-carrier-protein] synthase II [Pseudomonadota bacterium]